MTLIPPREIRMNIVLYLQIAFKTEGLSGLDPLSTLDPGRV